MTSLRALFITIGLAFAIWVADWAYRNLELVPEPLRGPPSAAALHNPWLATDRFLAKMGLDVKSVQGRDRLKQLPSPRDTLVVYSFGDGMSSSEYRKLMAWVEAGGYLIFPARQYFDKRAGKTGDLILDNLGIALKHRFSKRPAQNPGMTKEEQRNSSYDITRVTFTHEGSVDVGFDRHRYLEDRNKTADVVVKGKSGAHLLEFNRGKGRITVLSDMGFLGNPPGGLADEDNAYFIYLLVQDAAKVWLVYNAQYDPLLSVLWKSAPALCVALVVLLIAWMWWLRDAFGPQRPLDEGARRNILEQMLAAANFEWRVDKAKRRVELNRKLVMGDIRRKHPAIRGMNHNEICAFLARSTGLDEAGIAHALFDDWHGEREFIELTANLQQLREAL